MARKLVVSIVGDASSLEKTYAKAAKSTRAFGRDIDKTGRSTKTATAGIATLGKSLGIGFGAAAATAGLKDVIQTASDAAEQASKTGQVFGAQAQAVKDWSETTTKAFGVSRREALATASSFGALFKPLGIVGPQAVRQSEALTKLGADLASFYNTDVQDALDAIRSGIVGESEPLRRYGVLLSETRVQQEALAETGKKHAKTLTGQEKALARIKLIFQDTAQAQGDFARTSGGLANQTRIAQANIDDLKVSLGTGLIPVLTHVTKKANEAAGALGHMGHEARKALGHLPFGLGKQINLTNLAKLTPPGLAYEETKQWLKLAQTLGLIADTQKKTGRPGGANVFDRILSQVGTWGKPFKVMGPSPADVQQVKRTAQQLNQFFDAMVSRRMLRAGLQPLQAQLVQLGKVAGLIRQRIAVTKDITRQLNLEDQLLQVIAQQKDIRAQLAQQATDALSLNVQKAGLTATLSDDIAALQAVQANLKKRIKLEGDSLDLEQQLLGVQQQLVDVRKQAAEQAKAAKEAAQFAGLGLGTGGEDLAPSIANLKKQLTKVRDAVKGTILDTRANRGLFARIASELAGHFGALTDNVKAKIKEMLDAIDQQLKDHATDQTRFRHVSTLALARSLGLDLTPTQLRQLRAGLAGVGPNMTVPAGRAAAFAGTGAVHNYYGGVHVSGVNDLRDFEDKMTKRAKARPHPRRGAR